jgi:hypothetical protein
MPFSHKKRLQNYSVLILWCNFPPYVRCLPRATLCYSFEYLLSQVPSCSKNSKKIILSEIRKKVIQKTKRATILYEKLNLHSASPKQNLKSIKVRPRSPPPSFYIFLIQWIVTWFSYQLSQYLYPSSYHATLRMMLLLLPSSPPNSCTYDPPLPLENRPLF